MAEQWRVAPIGRCIVCGCTEDRACAGGCGWTDDSETLCDRCVGRAPWITVRDVIEAAVMIEKDADLSRAIDAGQVPQIFEWPQPQRRDFVLQALRIAA